MPYNKSIIYKRIRTIPAINKDQDKDLLFLNLEYIGQYEVSAVDLALLYYQVSDYYSRNIERVQFRSLDPTLLRDVPFSESDSEWWEQESIAAQGQSGSLF